MEQKAEFSPEAIERIRGWSIVDDSREIEWRRENCIKPKVEFGGYEARFLTEILDWNKEPRQERVFRHILSMLKGEGAIIALVGHRGTGKTTITAQIAFRLAWWWDEYHSSMDRPENRKRPQILGLAEYRKLVSLTEILKPLYSDHGTTATERLTLERERLCACGLLVIDEKHDMNALAVANRVLTDIIDRRYAKKKDTIIISNESAEEFNAQTNHSILSRITEHGETVECKWQSMRTRKP